MPITLRGNGNSTFSSGNLSLGDGNLVLANTHGIDFSATADGPVSTDSELLADYEEGRWTPVVISANGADSISGTRCYYMKVGRVVHLSAAANITNANNNVFRITGLPYAINNAVTTGPSAQTGYETVGSVMVNDPTPPANNFQLTPYVFAGNNSINFYWSRTGGAGWVQASGTSIGDAIIFSCSYLTT